MRNLPPGRGSIETDSIPTPSPDKNQFENSSGFNQTQKRIYSLNRSGIDEMENWVFDVMNLWNKRLDKSEKYLLKVKKERAHDKK